MLKLKGVSGTHFALTFDEQKRTGCERLELLGRDARVIYDGEIPVARAWNCLERSRGRAWRMVKVPVLKVVGELQFRLVVPNYDTTSTVYLDNIARFF